AALPPNPTRRCRCRRSLRRRRGAPAVVLSSNLSLPLLFHKPSAAHWGYVGGPDSWAAHGAPTRREPLAARVTGTRSSNVGEAPSPAWRPDLGDARATAMGAFRRPDPATTSLDLAAMDQDPAGTHRAGVGPDSSSALPLSGPRCRRRRRRIDLGLLREDGDARRGSGEERPPCDPRASRLFVHGCDIGAAVLVLGLQEEASYITGGVYLKPQELMGCFSI
ncbi:unnamed protein product, partial [Urochloa humidicola]